MKLMCFPTSRLDLVAHLVHVRLNTASDTFRWELLADGSFSVHSMYKGLITNVNVAWRKDIWKAKMPLKIKIFVWYLHSGVVLTNDNLLKRNWKENAKWFFVPRMRQLIVFFHCQLAKFIWRLVRIRCGVRPPNNIRHIFGSWLTGLDNRKRSHFILAASAICWAIWLSRNDAVFDNAPIKSSLQVVFRATHWLRFWAQLQLRQDDQELIIKA